MASFKTGIPSSLEAVLALVRKREESASGKIQIWSHRWLAVVEASGWLPRPGLLFRHAAGPDFSRRNSIDVDSLLILSLILHLLLFILFSTISLPSGPAEKPGPIVVQFIEQATPSVERVRPAVQRSVRPAPAKSQPVEVARAQKTEPVAVPAPQPEQSTASPQPPPLPGPKVLASLPAERTAGLTGQPVDKLVQLPTRQASGGGEPSGSARAEPAPSTAGIQGDFVPEQLRRGQNAPAAGDKESSGSSALSSPDFGPYLEMIRKRVQSVWKYPEGISGVHQISVVFVIDRGGKLVEARIVDSTNRSLDQSALQAMKLASPFPPIPESLKELAGTPLRVRLNIDFGLKAATP